tara:strand:- start:572 stop:772 length:201 start_codon:yes stop_codon:yes gene_type:complete
MTEQTNWSESIFLGIIPTRVPKTLLKHLNEVLAFFSIEVYFQLNIKTKCFDQYEKKQQYNNKTNEE